MPEQVPAPPNSHLKDIPHHLLESLGHGWIERLCKLGVLAALGVGMAGIAQMPDAPPQPAHVGSAINLKYPGLNNETYQERGKS